MKKLTSILTFLVTMPVAFAQDSVSEGIGKMLHNLFGYIFIDIGKLGMGDRIYEFIMRFLIWIVVFACLFYTARFVFKDQKRIQVTIAFVLALISVILIPVNVLEWILSGYSIVVALLLLAFPMIGVIFLIHKTFGAPERHNYAIKAFLYYLLAMLIHNIMGVKEHYNFPGFDDWIGFAEGICMILAVWNAIRAMFPGGGGEEGAPSSFWDRFGGDRGREPDVLRGSDADRRERGEEEEARRQAETEAARRRGEEQDTDRFVKDTLDREDDAKRGIDRLKDHYNRLNDAARRMLEGEAKDLKELRQLLDYMKKLKEGVESAKEKLKAVDEQLKKGDTVKLRDYRKELIDYRQKALSLINEKFPLLSEKILKEYNDILEKKKLSAEEMETLEGMVKEWKAMEKYGKLSRKGIGFLGVLQRRWMGWWQRIKRLPKGGKKRFKEMGAYRNRIISKLIEKIRGIYKELEELKAKLRKIVNYLITFTEKDMKRIREQEKIGKENETLVEEIKKLLEEIVKNPTKSKLTELNKKLKKLYDNSAISLDDVLNEERVRQMRGEVDKEWDKLRHLEDELDRYKKMSVEELMGEIEKEEEGERTYPEGGRGEEVYPEGKKKRRWWPFGKGGEEGAYPEGTYPKGKRAEEVSPYSDRERARLGRIAKGIADLFRRGEKELGGYPELRKKVRMAAEEAEEVYKAYAEGKVYGPEPIKRILRKAGEIVREAEGVYARETEPARRNVLKRLLDWLREGLRGLFSSVKKEAGEVSATYPEEGRPEAEKRAGEIIKAVEEAERETYGGAGMAGEVAAAGEKKKRFYQGWAKSILNGLIWVLALLAPLKRIPLINKLWTRAEKAKKKAEEVEKAYTAGKIDGVAPIKALIEGEVVPLLTEAEEVYAAEKEGTKAKGVIRRIIDFVLKLIERVFGEFGKKAKETGDAELKKEAEEIGAIYADAEKRGREIVRVAEEERRTSYQRMAGAVADILKQVQLVLQHAQGIVRSAGKGDSAPIRELLGRCINLQREAKEVVSAYAAGEKEDSRIRTLLEKLASFREELYQILADAATGEKEGSRLMNLLKGFAGILKGADQVEETYAAGVAPVMGPEGPTGAYATYGDIKAIGEGFRKGAELAKAETSQQLAEAEREVEVRAEEVQKKGPGAVKRFLNSIRKRWSALINGIINLYRTRIKGLWTRASARLKAAWQRRRREAKKRGEDTKGIDDAYKSEQKQLEATYRATLAEYGSMEAYAAKQSIRVNEILVEEDLLKNLNKYRFILLYTLDPLKSKEIINKIIKEINTLDNLESKKLKEEQPERSMTYVTKKDMLVRQEVANLKILRLQLTQALKKSNNRQIRQKYLEQAMKVLEKLINLNREEGAYSAGPYK